MSRLISTVEIRDSATLVLERVVQALQKTAEAEGRLAEGISVVDGKLKGSTRQLEGYARGVETLKRGGDEAYAATVKLADIQLRLKNYTDAGVVSATEAATIYANQAAKIDLAAKAAGALAAQLESLRQKYDPVYASAMRMNEELEELALLESNGIQITGGYAAALDNLSLKYDAVARSARDAQIAQEAMIAAARAANATQLAQNKYNALAGVVNMDLPASAQGATFEALDRRERELLEREKRLQMIGSPGFGLSAPVTGQYDAMMRNVQANEKLKKAFSATSEETKKAGEIARLTSRDYMILGYQLNDVATMAAMGASPFMIIASQAGQVVQVLQGGGGIKASLRQVGSALMDLVTPARLAMAGVAGLGVAVAASYIQWINQQDRLAASIAGVGRATGVTLDGLNKIAEAGAAASRISNSQGRNLAAQFAGTGAFRGDMVQDLVARTRRFSEITGQGLEEGGAELGKIFADPGKGAVDLANKLGGLTAATQYYIKTLQDSGQIQKAQSTLMEEYDKVVAKSADRTWSIVKAWQTGVGAVSDFFQSIDKNISKSVNGPSLQDQMDTLNARRNALQNEKNQLLPTPSWMRWLDPEGPSSAEQGRINEIDIQRRQLQQQIDKKAASVAAEAAREESRKLGVQASDVIIRSAPEFDQVNRVRAQLDLVKKALGDPNSGVTGGTEAAAEATARLNGAYKSLTDETGKHLTNADLATEKYQIEVAAINARTLAQRQSLTQMRLESAERGKLISELDRYIERIRAAKLEAERADKAARDVLRESTRSGQLVGLRSAPRAQAEIGQRFEELRTINGDNPALRQAEAIERQAAAYQAAIQPIRDANDALNEQNAMLNVNIATFGESEGTIAKQMALQNMLNEAAKNGIVVNDQLRAAYEALATKMGEYAQRQHDVNEEQKRIIDNADKTRAAFKGTLSDIAHGIAEGKSGKDIFKGIMAKVSSNLIDTGIQGLSDSMLDKEGKPLGGPVGKFLTDMLGIGKQRGSSPANPLFVSIAGGLGLPGGANLGGPTGTISIPLPGTGSQTINVPYGAGQMNGGGPGTSFNFGPGGGAIPGTGTPTAYSSAAERDLMIRTLFGEAGGEGQLGQIAVANVMKNRLNAKGQPYGKSLTDILTAEKQFSTWNPGDQAGVAARKLDPNSPEYKKLGEIADAVMAGKVGDPTGGANQFFNPKTATSAWTRDRQAVNGLQIGRHKFVGGASAVQPIDFQAPVTVGGTRSIGDASADKLFLQSRFTGWDKSGAPIAGLKDEFASRLAPFLKENKDFSILSGYRSNERQAELFREKIGELGGAAGIAKWDEYVKNAGGDIVAAGEAARPWARGLGVTKWVAPPGKSHHNWGEAADLSYKGGGLGAAPRDEVERMQASAGRYGLRFPMGHEDWHVEPMKNWRGQIPGVGDQSQTWGGAGAEAKPLVALAPALQKVNQQATNLNQTVNQTTPALGGAAEGFKGIGSSLGSIGSMIGSMGGSKNGGILGGAIGQIFSLFGGILKIPGFAGGTDSAPGGLAVVGEKGPELVRLPRGSRVTPNHLLNRGNPQAGGLGFNFRGGDTNINVAGSMDDKAMTQIRQEIKASEARTKSDIGRNWGSYQSSYSNAYG